MKLVSILLTCTFCTLLVACNTTANMPEQPHQQLNHPETSSLSKAIRYAENTQVDPFKPTHYVYNKHTQTESVSTEPQSVHTRLLAAGGFIAGAIGGS